MKTCIICDSITGNTQMLADKIATMFESAPLEESDIIFVGSWTNKGAPSPHIQETLSYIKNKKIFFFGTCGFGGSQDYFNLLFDRAKRFIDSSNTILGFFYCPGKISVNITQRYENLPPDIQVNLNIKSNTEILEKAMDHPDALDLEILCATIQTCIGNME